jgi:outer membrane receptor protein involved in Fe transport
MSRLRGSLLILAVVCAAVTAHGQAVTANLQGVVSDASGAVVAGARVTATNLDTGEKRSVESNAEGFYRFNLLPRGPYEVRTQKMGFADQSLKLTLTVGDTVTANFALKVAGQTQQVEVTSLASQVDTSSSQIEQPISQVQIADLPINDRNFQQLANLIPGVSPSPSYDPTKRLYGGIVSGGATARSSGISVDGGNFNDNIVGGPVGLVPEDAIQEFQVITNQYSAEYGHSSGPFINVVTKSGSNTLHGSGFLLYRQKDLQANGFFEKKKPDFDREQFGGSLGGPLVKDRTFGFYAIERNRQQKSQTVDTGGVYPQFEGSFPAPFRDLLMVTKLDHHFTTAESLSFRASFQRNTSREGLRIDPNLLFGGPPAENAFQVATNENLSWQATQTSLLSTRTLNQFTVQFNRFINNLKPTSLGINLRFPSVVFGENSSTPQNVQQDRLQLRDDFSTQGSWHGLHSIKFGADLNPRIKYNALFDLVKNTSFFFSVDDPGITCSSPTSCHTTLIQNPNSPVFFALRGIGSTKENGTTAWQMAYYIQDDWKISRRLTVNLGVRYEFESGFIDAGFHQPLEGVAPFFDSRTRKNPKLSFGPRIGFAYDPAGNGRTVIRGGYGIYYDSTPWEIGYIDRTFNGVKYFIDAFVPTQPDVNDPAFQGPLPPPGGFAVDGKVRQPYTHQWSGGIGQQLPWGIVLDASYVHILGIHGWMSRELNPQSATRVAPFPSLGLFTSFQATNLSHYNGLQVSARKNLDKRLQFQASYTLSKAVGLSDDIFEPGVPQDSNNIFADKGPTLRDARHRFVLSGIVNLPLGFQTANIVALQSGRPFNITTGTDDNGDGHLKDRPPGVGRNAGRAAPTYVWDTRLSRPFKIGERVEISPTVDLFNVVNHPNFDPESYNGVISSPTFGKPSDIISPPRQLQLGVRATF